MNIENQVNLMGRLTKNNELKAYQSEKGAGFVLKNSIAVSRRNKEESPDFIDITLWGKTAQFIAQYTKKGDKIAVFGELMQETWENEQGESRKKISVNVENAKIIALKAENSEQAEAQKQEQAEQEEEQLAF